LPQRLQPHLAHIAATPSPEVITSKTSGAAGGKGLTAGMTSTVDDRLYAFEAVGLLLSQVRGSTTVFFPCIFLLFHNFFIFLIIFLFFNFYHVFLWGLRGL
jgi:hypothetical protein